jgi:ABC-type sugar transport system substrate-binding protein
MQISSNSVTLSASAAVALALTVAVAAAHEAEEGAQVLSDPSIEWMVRLGEDLEVVDPRAA